MRRNRLSDCAHEPGRNSTRTVTPRHGVDPRRTLRGGVAALVIVVSLSARGFAQSAPDTRETAPPAASQALPRDVQHAEQSRLSERMNLFLGAVSRAKVDSIAAFFPRRGDWTYQRTTHYPDTTRVGLWRFRAEDIQPAIQSGPLEASFRMNYEGQAVGSLVHQLFHRRGRWRQLPGSRFVPPGGTAASDIFVTWRLENGVWVISSMADELYAGARLPAWCC
jgi:hypothetical protein